MSAQNSYITSCSNQINTLAYSSVGISKYIASVNQLKISKNSNEQYIYIFSMRRNQKLYLMSKVISGKSRSLLNLVAKGHCFRYSLQCSSFKGK